MKKLLEGKSNSYHNVPLFAKRNPMYLCYQATISCMNVQNIYKSFLFFCISLRKKWNFLQDVTSVEISKMHQLKYRPKSPQPDIILQMTWAWHDFHWNFSKKLSNYVWITRGQSLIRTYLCNYKNKFLYTYPF